MKNIYKNLNLNNTITNTKEIFKNNNTFDNLYKKGYRYPNYPNHKEGRNLLYYIRIYLISRRKNKQKQIYPTYIFDKNKNTENEKSIFVILLIIMKLMIIIIYISNITKKIIKQIKIIMNMNY